MKVNSSFIGMYIYVKIRLYTKYETPKETGVSIYIKYSYNKYISTIGPIINISNKIHIWNINNIMFIGTIRLI